ncbi:MAG: hypothetical protein JWQ43_3189, partial [Glaciihabitans sp.]|nr:hypothetical protein [Glaciihabitans sp.]
MSPSDVFLEVTDLRKTYSVKSGFGK